MKKRKATAANVKTVNSEIWHILGAGAIGCLWASHAYLNKRPCTLILRSAETLNRYQHKGHISAEIAGMPQLLPLTACCPKSIGGPISQLLICCKSNQTIAALSSIEHAITTDATIVLLQNGLGVAEKVRQRFPRATVLQASTTEGAYRPEEFSVIHAGRGETAIGQHQNQPPVSALPKIANSLSFAPLTVSVSDNIDAMLWRKLGINCAINPLTAIYHCRNGELLDKPEALAQLHSIIDEFLLLSEASGRASWVHGLREQIIEVAQHTASNRSSMLQDILAERETEIEAITGYLCTIAKQQKQTLATNFNMLEQLRILQSKSS